MSEGEGGGGFYIAQSGRRADLRVSCWGAQNAGEPSKHYKPVVPGRASMEIVCKDLTGELHRGALHINGNPRVGSKKRYISYTYHP